MNRAQRRTMVERVNPVLPVSQQCRLLAVSRSAVYRKPAEVSAEDLAIMALIDRQYPARPYYGSRRRAAWLATQGHVVNRKRVQRLMRLLGLVAIYQRPNTSKPAEAHKIYPYLLGGIAIERSIRSGARTLPMRLPRFNGRFVSLQSTSWSWRPACRLRRLSVSGIPGPNATASDYTNPRCS